MKFIDITEIVLIHDQIIEKIGGSSGLREPGLLAAISEKPHASFGGEDLYPSLFEKAAAIFEALCNYHVFVDGNKRTAITVLEYFLHINGYVLSVSNLAKEEFTLKVAMKKFDLAEVAKWIKEHSKKVPQK